MVSEHDYAHLGEIIAGEGDWYSAIVLRFLNRAVFKADNKNFKVLWEAFPKECEAIFLFYEWPEEDILSRVDRAYSDI